MVACGLLAAVLAGLAGCDAGAGNRGQLASRYPPDRAQAAAQAGREGDVRSIDKLVDLLEDLDPAVRLYAIGALQRLTGETYGYRYYADDADRRAGADRWRAALRDGAVQVRSAPPGPPAGAGQPTALLQPSATQPAPGRSSPGAETQDAKGASP